MTDRAWRPVHILLVEDSPGDTRLIMDALERASVPVSLDTVEDGDAALAFLRREEPHAGAPRPDLVLLDLNLPGTDGHTVLAEVKSDPDLRSIPVVVLTSSAAQADILRSYDLHANSYITKPTDPDDFMRVLYDIEGYWFRTAALPT